ncbi:glycosyltransferase [Candidatus Latescibacterota bacterium]
MTRENYPDISVIMPAFNEGAHLYENIRKTREALHASGYEAEIVVVDDGSLDNTLTEIERAARDFDDIIAVRNPYNMGKGMALRTGFDHARGKLIVFLDADLDLDPSQIKGLVDELASGPSDVVVTSKHHPRSHLAYPFSRKVASIGYSVIIKLLFGLPLRDTQTGLKIFRREVLDRIFHRILVKRYAYDVELLATAIRFGYRVREIPVVLDFRRDMTWGRIRVGDVLRIFADTLAIFYRLRILKYYDRDRPRARGDLAPVLVVTRGVPPSEVVLHRLVLDTNTRIACLGLKSPCKGVDSGGLVFRDDTHLRAWLDGEGADIAYIGFLGADCLPLESWVKNALRNFADNTVQAICGPVVPAPPATFGGQVAAMLYSSVITAGPNQYLHAITRVKQVRRGLMDNVFIRSSRYRQEAGQDGELTQSDGMLFDTTPANTALLYDPDVAVSRPVQPFMVPYLVWIAGVSAAAGARFFAGNPVNSRLWILSPVLLVLSLTVGWLVMPAAVFQILAGLYLLAVVLSGIIFLEPLPLPFFIGGVVLEHLVRAVAVPAGMLGRLISGGKWPGGYISCSG